VRGCWEVHQPHLLALSRGGRYRGFDSFKVMTTRIGKCRGNSSENPTAGHSMDAEKALPLVSHVDCGRGNGSREKSQDRRCGARRLTVCMGEKIMQSTSAGPGSMMMLKDFKRETNRRCHYLCDWTRSFLQEKGPALVNFSQLREWERAHQRTGRGLGAARIVQVRHFLYEINEEGRVAGVAGVQRYLREDRKGANAQEGFCPT